MSSMWRRAMLYLGLGPDEEYDDYDSSLDDRAPAAGSSLGGGLSNSPTVSPQGPVRPMSTNSARPSPVQIHEPDPDPPSVVSAVRTLPPQNAPDPEPERERDPFAGAAVRPIPAVAKAKPHVVSPASFNEAQEVADRFKSSTPVIINLQGADRDLSRRLIDFASGLCYGLGGQMERVANQVYLLTPTDVEVSDEERQRLQERGLHDS